MIDKKTENSEPTPIQKHSVNNTQTRRLVNNRLTCVSAGFPALTLLGRWAGYSPAQRKHSVRNF